MRALHAAALPASACSPGRDDCPGQAQGPASRSPARGLKLTSACTARCWTWSRRSGWPRHGSCRASGHAGSRHGCTAHGLRASPGHGRAAAGHAWHAYRPTAGHAGRLWPTAGLRPAAGHACWSAAGLPGCWIPAAAGVGDSSSSRMSTGLADLLPFSDSPCRRDRRLSDPSCRHCSAPALLLLISLF
jgi:hypothetical protein